MKLKKIKPGRYVYHVSYQENRLDILFGGIKTYPYSELKLSLLFVNNHPLDRSTSEFWPLPIDTYDVSNNYGNYFKIAFNSRYDYWRIDTLKIQADWYIDPYMEHDHEIYLNNCRPEYFLCTPMAIPTSALDLMEYDIHGYNRFAQTKNDEHPELVYSSFNQMVNYKRYRA